MGVLGGFVGEAGLEREPTLRGVAVGETGLLVGRFAGAAAGDERKKIGLGLLARLFAYSSGFDRNLPVVGTTFDGTAVGEVGLLVDLLGDTGLEEEPTFGRSTTGEVGLLDDSLGAKSSEEDLKKIGLGILANRFAPSKKVDKYPAEAGSLAGVGVGKAMGKAASSEDSVSS